jgi:hypothetical protein
MKNPSGTLFLPVILLYLTACTKTTSSSFIAMASSTSNTTSSNQSESSAPANAWNLVTDSTFEGVGLGNHAVDYTGVSGDYFSFSTDGYVYTREGTLLDTLTYQMFSDSSVIISHFGIILNGIPDTSIITGLTGTLDSGNAADTIVIESPFVITPGGEFWRKVTLSR